MANKRMFTMKIVDSDAFLEMPLSTQCLYFHLNMRADDDGFIGNPKKIMRIIGASDDDLKLLIAKRFLLSFDDGVIVIKHWRMHNTLSQNRYHETQYIDEKSMLKLKDNGSYSFDNGKRIDDKKLIESSNRQTQDMSKTDKRRTKDGQKTDSDLDLDLDLDKDLDLNNNPFTSLQGRADKDKAKKEFKDTTKKIIDYLNNKCGTRYRYNTPNTIKHINARLNDGYTEEDFYDVIDKKADEWIGTEHEKYLRPDTLFGTKFESYLNQKINKQGYHSQTAQMLNESYEMMGEWAKRKEMEVQENDSTGICQSDGGD